MNILYTFVAMKIASFEYPNVKSLKMKENTVITLLHRVEIHYHHFFIYERVNL